SGAPGQDGCGGGFYNRGILWATNTAFVANLVQGGAGGAGGSGGHGGTAFDQFGRPRFGGPGGNGGTGGSGGDARGACLYNLTEATLVRSSFAANRTVGGASGNGGDAGAG